MGFKRLNDHIDELTRHLEAYLDSRVEYYRLRFFKKFMKGFSLVSKLAIAGSCLLFVLGFISFGFAFLIGEAIGSVSSGFFIVGGVYFIVFILILLFWKKMIEGIFLEKFSTFIFNDKHPKNELKASTSKEVVEEDNEI